MRDIDRMDIVLSAGGRIGETVAVSLGVMSKNRDGYLRDITNNSRVNDERVIGARFGLAMPLANEMVGVLVGQVPG